MVSEGEEGVREGETDEDLNHKPHDIKVYPDQDIANIVDNTLDQHDANDDGYIEYAEFVRAQRKARGKTDY